MDEGTECFIPVPVDDYTNMIAEHARTVTELETILGWEETENGPSLAQVVECIRNLRRKRLSE